MTFMYKNCEQMRTRQSTRDKSFKCKIQYFRYTVQYYRFENRIKETVAKLLGLASRARLRVLEGEEGFREERRWSVTCSESHLFFRKDLCTRVRARVPFSSAFRLYYRRAAGLTHREILTKSNL